MKKQLLLFFICLASLERLSGVVVTTTADSGPGSLRDAISVVNSGGSNTITFNIPEADLGFNPVTGTWKIVPLTALPPIINQVIIDGTTQPFAAVQAPIRIELSGEGYTFFQNLGNFGPFLPFGLYLAPGSDGSIIKGLAINRFVGLPEDFLTGRVSGAGIHIESSNNTIIQNYLGTNIDGKRSPDGITLEEQTRANSTAVECFGPGAFGNVIGTVNHKERNIIAGSRFNLGSVRLSNGAHDNRVIGNYINVDVTGHDLVGQTSIGVGIDIGSPNNCVGGEEKGEGNVIAGCAYEQVGIYNFLAPGFYEPSLNNKIIGNILGLDACGSKILGTQEGDGVSLTAGASGTIIKKNVISGNNRGIYAYQLELQVNDLTISDNKVGADVSGKAVLGNKNDGIHLQFSSNSVIQHNLVVGNLNGIVIDGQSRDNKVVANCINHNRFNGIKVGTQATLFTQNTVIGGSDEKDRNVITNNGKNGILLQYFSSQNTTIQGNTIGADKNGKCKGNTKNGIEILCSSDNLVKENLITCNGCAGVFVDDMCAKACETDVRFDGVVYRDPVTGQPVTMTRGVDIKEIVLAAVGNKIVCNSIFGNGKRGIALSIKPKENDSHDLDCGPNRLQNHPIIRAVIKNDCDTLIRGALSSVPCTDFLVQLFNNTKNRKKDCVTEGKTLISEFTVHTDRAGFVTFEQSVKCPVEFVSATATRCDTSDTSEFSKNKEVVMCHRD